MRVGLRRLRAAFTAFRPLVEDAEFPRLKAETKWLAAELDTARDVDVFIHESFRCTKAQSRDRQALASLGACLLHAQSCAYERALAAVESPRFHGLMLRSLRCLEAGEWLQSDEPVRRRLREGRTGDFARDQLDRMRHQVRKRGRRLAQLDNERRHRLRIKAKTLRYAAEFFSESFDRKRRRRSFLSALGELQDGLGRLHDIAVAPELALGLVRGESAEAGFAAGLIVAARRTSTERDERAALKAFEQFDGAPPFWR